MGQIANYYTQAELAFAAYANLFPDVNPIPALRDDTVGMSPTQARRFAQRWRVVDQFNDSFSGLSATVFEEVATGKRSLAIRGTTPSDVRDLTADLGVLLHGIPDLSLQYRALRERVSGWTLEGTLPGRFTVSGHSLGGWLAAGLVSDFGPLIEQAYLYNAPGVLGATELVPLLARALGIGAWSGDPARVSNLRAAAGTSLVAGTGLALSPPIAIEIEAASGLGLGNHSISRLVDALALHEAFVRLAPVLTLSETAQILRAASAQNARTLEAALDALRVTLLGEAAGAVPTAEGERDEFYRNLYALTDSAAYRTLAGSAPLRVLAGSDAATLARAAAADFGSFLALRQLLPFAIEGSPGALIEAHGDLYFRWSADRAKRAAGASDLEFTDAYLADRAQFLAWKNTYFSADGQTVLRGEQNENRLFENRDRAGNSDLSLTVVGNLAAGGNSAAAANPARVLFGNTASDVLAGGILADRLYGDAGSDWLQGGAGNDYLEGGAGLDVYSYNAFRGFLGLTSGHDGEDVIRDSDGRGVLRYSFTQSGLLSNSASSAVIAEAAVKLSDTQWQSADGKFTSTKTPNEQGRTDLVITINGDAGGRITLKDFREGDFGIRLWEPRDAPRTASTIRGDRKPQDFDPAAPGIQTQFDALGNLIVTGEAEPDRNDVLFGNRPEASGAPATPGERIEAGGGHDIIFSDRPRGEADNGFGNADWILAGPGRDLIEAGAGDDLIEAGPDGVLDGDAGGDIADGGAGDDEIYAEAKMALADTLRAGNEAAPTGLKGELLSGAAGDDWIIGDRADDLLLGGSGADLIVGGAGEDTIWGDAELIDYTRGWRVERLVTLEAGRKTYHARVSGVMLAESAVGAADVIYGGGGADWVFAGASDDFVDAGSGEDAIFGEASSDILIGGSGNDVLAGDNPEVVAAAEEGGDYLDGGAGDDELFGHGGDDILIGGSGNDLLNGGGGRDIYVFNKGDGKDTVVDTLFGIDHPEAGILVLGEGFSRADITFRLGSLLVDLGPVDPSDPGSSRDEIRFEGFDRFDPFATPVLGEIRFADGERMSFEEILAQGFDIEGTGENDDGHDGAHPMLVGSAVTDRIRGFAGNDILLGAAGDDVLDGGAGDDRLQGGEGNDVLIGGPGADALQGGAGADTYVADFEDIINDDSGGDLIDLGAATPQELTVARFDFNGQPLLVISRTAEGNPALGLTIFGDVTAQRLRFAFGSGELSSDQFFDIAFTGSLELSGTEGDDTLRGFGGADVLRGFAGHDVLHGGAGDDSLFGAEGEDILEGGAGNDYVSGGAGGDTYFFGRGFGHDQANDAGGDGTDRIVLAPDVLRQDVTLERSIEGNLTLVLSPEDRLTVTGHYSDAANRIEEIQFGDGTVLTAAELDAVPLPPITGTDEADVLVGTNFSETLIGLAGDDTLDGRGGDDVLHGGTGLDTYIFNFAMGRDRFVDEGGRIALQAGLGFNDLQAARVGDDLELTIRGTGTGALLRDYFAASQHWRIEDATGAQTTPEGVLEATAQRAQDWLGTQREDYRSALKARIALQYLHFGYVLTPEGTYYSPWQACPWLGSVTASASWNTQTETRTISFFGGATTTTTTTSGFTSWNHSRPSLFESTVRIQEETIASDEPQIFAFDGRSDTFETQPVVVRVMWHGSQRDLGTASQITHSDFILGRERDPNSGQLLPVGIVTTTTIFRNFSGIVTGQVTAIAPGATAEGGLFPQFIHADLTRNAITERISEVIAGPGDNEILGGSLVEAGDGNDTVFSNGFVHGGAGDDMIQGAEIAIGGPGNDWLSGAIMYGGAGEDYLQGDWGANRFVFDVQDLGRDTVVDSGGLRLEQLADWYYASIGIPDWRSALLDPETEDRLSIEEGIERGLLPPLPRIAAHDWGALAPLYAAGVIETDRVEFAHGVILGEVSLSWGEVASISPVSGALEAYTTLDVGWGAGNMARIVIPHAEDPLGSGIEQLRFADGTVVPIQHMVAAAAPAPSFDPQHGDNVLVGSARGEVILGWAGNDTLAGGPGDDRLAGDEGDDVYVFAHGDGVDYVFDEGGADVVRFALGIAPEDVLVTADPYGALILTLATGDRLTLSGWFDETTRVESVEFSDGAIWDTAVLGRRIIVTPATEFDDVIAGTPADDVIEGLGGHDQISGLGGDDVVEGGAGNDMLQGGAGNDILRGGEGADALSDGPGNNVFDGGTGEDSIFAYGPPLYPDGGRNFVIGGTGNDSIYSAATDNVIAFNSGDGHDTVHAAYALTLSLGAGIAPSALALSRDGPDLVLAIGAADSIRLTRQFEPDPQAWPRITLQLFGSVHRYDFNAVIADFEAALAAEPALTAFPLDGVLQAHETSVSETDALGGALAYQYGTAGNLNALSEAAIRQVLANANFGMAPQSIAISRGNQSPVLALPIADQSAQEDSAYSFSIPDGTFSDADPGDTLAYTAALADGSPLPAWLSFDGVSRSFSGTPANDDVGAFEVAVTATDAGGLSASDTFRLTVANVNDAPLLAAPIADQGALEDAAFSFTLPPDTFFDVDAGDALHLTASLARGGALPAWLSFEATTRTFSGAPTNDDVGALDIVVTAADREGLSATDTFTLTVANVNDPPVAGDDTGTATEDSGPVLLMGAALLANDTDVDAGDTKTIVSVTGSAAGARVSLLGGEVVYDVGGLFQSLGRGASTTDTFTYTMADAAGATSAATVTITITGANDTPQLITPLADQLGHQNAPFAFQVPQTTFSDADASDALSFSACLADGAPLPAWLGFDAASASFHGTPSEFDVGELDIRVTAADRAGASASGTFTLTVSDASILNETHLGTRRRDVIVTGFANDLIDAGHGDDRILSGAGRDTVLGGAGHDHLDGGAGNDVLHGGEGHDVLLGGSGDDLLAGGEGNDRLAGGLGDDLYVYELGGHELIEETGGADTLRLGEGILPEGVRLERRREDLVLELKGDAGSLTVKDWFASEAARIETIEFAEGTSWNGDEIRSRLARQKPRKRGHGEPHHDPGHPHGRDDHYTQPEDRTPRGRDEEKRSERGSERLGELLEAFLGRDPRSESAALAQELEERSGQRGAGGLTRQQIARRWQAVDRSLQALEEATGEPVRLAAGPHTPLATALLGAGAEGWSGLAAFGASGVLPGAAHLRTFQGLEEGLRRLAA